MRFEIVAPFGREQGPDGHLLAHWPRLTGCSPPARAWPSPWKWGCKKKVTSDAAGQTDLRKTALRRCNSTVGWPPSPLSLPLELPFQRGVLYLWCVLRTEHPYPRSLAWAGHPSKAREVPSCSQLRPLSFDQSGVRIRERALPPLISWNPNAVSQRLHITHITPNSRLPNFCPGNRSSSPPQPWAASLFRPSSPLRDRHIF